MHPSLASSSVRPLLLYAAAGLLGLGVAQPAAAQELLPNGLPVVAKTFELPEIEAPERHAVRELGESPFYYRIPDNTVVPWSRSAIGAQVTLPTNEETDSFARATEGARFSFDLLCDERDGLALVRRWPRAGPARPWTEQRAPGPATERGLRRRARAAR